MKRHNLLTGELTQIHTKPQIPSIPGCKHCPSDKVEGVHKVINLDRVIGRRAMLWAQNPGDRENSRRRELVGSAGRFFWYCAEKEGLSREDFDIQNVVRCWTFAYDENGRRVLREPNPAELFCCSTYNEEALRRNAGKAQVHLILGEVAGIQLLDGLYRKDIPIQWHEEWNAYVVTAPHPSYILRSGGERAGWLFDEFLLRLRAVKAVLRYPGRFGYVRSRDYKAILGKQELENLMTEILAESDAGNCIAVDIEDGVVNGDNVVLMIAFAWGHYTGPNWWQYEGKARAVPLYHPRISGSITSQHHVRARHVVREILRDKHIIKEMQHGVYDVRKVKQLLGYEMRGHDNRDSQYAAFLRWPHHHTYALDNIGRFYFPEFADYKEIVGDHTNFANVPLYKLMMRCCGDADLTHRIIERELPHINPALLQVYSRAAFVFDAMQRRGPYLDRVVYDKITPIIQERLRLIEDTIQQVADNPALNVRSNLQIAALLYGKLKLPEINGRSTEEDTLRLLAEQTNSKVPGMVIEHRSLSKALSTYLPSYLRSAEMHGGMLHTIWNLTGASSGRASSGGGGRAKGVVNFQNFHNHPLLKNLLISDLNWRTVLEDKS